MEKTVITVGDCAVILTGRNIDGGKLNTDGRGLPYIVGASCMQDGRLTCQKYYDGDASRETVLSLGDIIISVVGTLGKFAINDIGDCILSKHVCAVSFVPQIIPEYGLLCLLASLGAVIPPDDGTATGFSRKLDPQAIADCPLVLVSLDYQRMLVERMVMLCRCFYVKKPDEVRTDDLPDDPIELCEWFKRQVRENIERQESAVNEIERIIREANGKEAGPLDINFEELFK